MADPGWYPQQDGTRRYWDGTAWTNQIENIGAGPLVTPTAVSHGAGKAAWFKTRTAVGVGGVLLGLVVGSQSANDSSGNVDSMSKTVATLKANNDDLKANVAKLTKQSTTDQESVDDQIRAAVEKATVAAEAARESAVAKAIAEERRKADARVSAAKKAASHEPLGLTGGSGSGSGSLDPRFDTCGEAQSAGYGNYHQGVDPEYDWYQDRDGDGVVCE